jgi:hypothetical protein
MCLPEFSSKKAAGYTLQKIPDIFFHCYSTVIEKDGRLYLEDRNLGWLEMIDIHSA